MSESAKKNPTAQNTIEEPPEYNAENAKNPKPGSDVSIPIRDVSRFAVKSINCFCVNFFFSSTLP